MKQNLNTDRVFTVDVDADLRIDCDAGAIYINANGRAIYVRFSSLRVAFHLVRELSKRDNLKAIDRALKCIDVTVYWRNSRLGILGSKGSTILLQTLIGVQKIIGWSALVSASRLRLAR